MAQSKLYYENAVALLTEHPDGYALFSYRPGKRQPEQLQEMLLHTAALLTARGWHRILNDQRHMEPFSTEETAYALEFWQAHTRRLGYGICVASVLAHNVFARLAATSMRQELRQAGIGYRLFDDEQQARSWLREQVTAPALK